MNQVVFSQGSVNQDVFSKGSVNQDFPESANHADLFPERGGKPGSLFHRIFLKRLVNHAKSSWPLEGRKPGPVSSNGGTPGSLFQDLFPIQLEI